MPASSVAAATPANSAHAVPRLANDERHQRRASPPGTVALAQERHRTATGHHPQPGAEIVEQDEHHGRDDQHPQQLVAVVGTEDRVCSDPRRVVVGQPREEARPEDGGEGCEAARPAQAHAHARDARARGAREDGAWATVTLVLIAGGGPPWSPAHGPRSAPDVRRGRPS